MSVKLPKRGFDQRTTPHTRGDAASRTTSSSVMRMFRRGEVIRRIEVSTYRSGVRRWLRHTMPGTSLITMAPGGSDRMARPIVASAASGPSGQSSGCNETTQIGSATTAAIASVRTRACAVAISNASGGTRWAV